jgi:CubicO group peptidase (beta-lactamase class C family)
MRNHLKFCIASVFMLLAYSACVSTPGGVPLDAVSNSGVGDIDILNVLRQVRKSYNVSAMAAALVTDQGLQKIAAIGTRKWGTDSPVTVNDLWHLGSDTKVMTATLAAILVEEGKLKWTTTMAEVFPDLATIIDSGYRDVFLLQLLSHQAGLPANLNYASISQSIPVRDQRLQAVRIALRDKPLSTPGTKYLYSNLGYIIVGAMIERITNTDWETAITQKVFAPLKMTSVGFGGLGTPGMIDQPWGHRVAGRPAASNGPTMDNPPVLGPAGRVHCTLQDWALFIQDQLRGARGKSGLLSPESYQMLQKVHFGGNYALGWGVVNRDWAGGKALNHTGCNTMYFALVWIAPAKNFAILVCTNEGMDSFPATDKAAWEIIKIAEARLSKKIF